ncbi:MAG: copper oxidase [Deltaproteobacteria bacterium]|nr:copper oxidase [Deltaproteobacteria bacterium]
MVSRRGFLGSTTAAVGGLLLAAESRGLAQPAPARMDPVVTPPRPRAPVEPASPPERDGRYLPVITPDGVTLPWRRVEGVKVFHLTAEEVRDHEFAPGLQAHCWGYNGRTPGPTIEIVEGDRCRFYVTNRLPEPTSVHWHGVPLANGMDGVAGLTQRAIGPGETFLYEITFRRAGTFMYHPHFDEMTQMALGMMGMLVVHPRRPRSVVDRDYVLMTSEWFIRPGARRPDPARMNDFNLLTFNSKAFPGTSALVARTGERVRLRIGNLSAMDHHPIHLHGPSFKVVATDGGPIPEAGQWPETTVLVPVGSTRDVELVATDPGDWALHCHMTHHVMTQMGHDAPNMVGTRGTRRLDARVQRLIPGYMTMGQAGMGGMGEMAMPVPPNSLPMRGSAGPFGYIDMGGMFTVLKVRDTVPEDGSDPGWYRHPGGTVAAAATPEQLERDGLRAEVTAR